MEEEVQLVAAVVVTTAFAWAGRVAGASHWVKFVGLVNAAVMEIKRVAATFEDSSVVIVGDIVHVDVSLMWATSTARNAVKVVFLAAVTFGLTLEAVLGLAPDITGDQLTAFLVSVALVINWTDVLITTAFIAAEDIFRAMLKWWFAWWDLTLSSDWVVDIGWFTALLLADWNTVVIADSFWFSAADWFINALSIAFYLRFTTDEAVNWILTWTMLVGWWAFFGETVEVWEFIELVVLTIIWEDEGTADVWINGEINTMAKAEEWIDVANVIAYAVVLWGVNHALLSVVAPEPAIFTTELLLGTHVLEFTPVIAIGFITAFWVVAIVLVNAVSGFTILWTSAGVLPWVVVAALIITEASLGPWAIWSWFIATFKETDGLAKVILADLEWVLTAQLILRDTLVVTPLACIRF